MFFNLALRLPFCLSSSLPFVKSFSGCAKIYTIKTTTELVDYETDTWQLTRDQQLVDTKVKKIPNWLIVGATEYTSIL